MEIVINKCFGGFELSRAALELLTEKGTKTFNSWEELKDNNGIWILCSKTEHYSNYNDQRTDKNLIEVVKLLGDASNGSCAELKVIEIPDGIDYDIGNYDGMETVRETPRSW